MFNVNSAIASALTPRAGVSKLQRGIDPPLESKYPVTDLPSIISEESDRDIAKRSAESSMDHNKLVMEETRGDDQKSLLTYQSKGIPAQEPPKRPLGSPANVTVALPPSTLRSVVERPVTSPWEGNEMGLGALAEHNTNEIKELEKRVRKWNPKMQSYILI